MLYGVNRLLRERFHCYGDTGERQVRRSVETKDNTGICISEQLATPLKWGIFFKEKKLE